MQLIGADDILGLLVNITLSIRRLQLGRDRRIDDGAQDLRELSTKLPISAIRETMIWIAVLGIPALTEYIDMWSPLKVHQPRASSERSPVPMTGGVVLYSPDP